MAIFNSYVKLPEGTSPGFGREETYQHMGITPDPITRRMVPPVAEPPKLNLSSEASGGNAARKERKGVGGAGAACLFTA